MDESSLEQQIRESTDRTLIVRKTGALGLAQPGLMAGRQAGTQSVRQNHPSTPDF